MSQSDKSADIPSGVMPAHTHVRVLAHEATPTATPHIVGLARMDLFLVAGQELRLDMPHQVRFETFADEAVRVRACTPLQLAVGIWHPTVPQVLVGHGSATWDSFNPSLTAGLPRIDTALVARALLPEAPEYGLEPLCHWLGIGTCDAGPLTWGLADPAVPATADRVVRQTAALLLALLDLVEQAELSSTDPSIDAVLGPLAGDGRLQLMTQISAVPGPPLQPLPDPWCSPDEWYRFGSRELEWVANNPDGWDDHRAGAQAELRRRAERDAARLLPRRLLRRLPLAAG